VVPLPRGRARSAVLCAVLTALALTLTACATSQKQLSVETVGAAHGDSSPGLPARLAPGTLLSAVPITTAAALPGAAVTFSVRYVSSDDSGNRIVVTGLVSLPRGFCPSGRLAGPELGPREHGSDPRLSTLPGHRHWNGPRLLGPHRPDAHVLG
jgi:hypothetical protein